ncbi:MAG: phosphomannomutase [Nitrososphaerota archaeon]
MKISISGIRGIFNQVLNLNNIINFSRLFSSFIINNSINSGKKCLVARDTRPSSDIILRTVSAAIMEKGIDVFDLGVAPTPFVFRESIKYGNAIIVTASHNPLEWNGLKFVINGRGMFEEELDSIQQQDATSSTGFGKSYHINSKYILDILEFMRKNRYLDDGRKRTNTVGLDPGGGAICSFIPKLYDSLNQDFSSINDIAGISSRSPDPTTDNLFELRKLVLSKKLHLGFAFDMDADRLVVVDRNGNKLSTDLTLLLCIASTLYHGAKKFVVSIDTSNAIGHMVTDHGGTLNYSKVGEANVVKQLLNLKADAGGEGSSAGFIMPKFNMCRDGILASVIISSLNEDLYNDCIEIASNYSTIRSKVPIQSNFQKPVIEKFEQKFKAKSFHIIKMDGTKILIDEKSWILIRSSNTEHAVRISVESSPDNVLSIFNDAKKKVQSIYEEIK